MPLLKVRESSKLGHLATRVRHAGCVLQGSSQPGYRATREAFSFCVDDVLGRVEVPAPAASVLVPVLHHCLNNQAFNLPHDAVGATVVRFHLHSFSSHRYQRRPSHLT